MGLYAVYIDSADLLNKMELTIFYWKLAYTTMFISYLSSHSYHRHLVEIESHLLRFEQALAASEEQYNQAQALQSDPALKSALLEAHTIHLNRQLNAIERMEALHREVLDKLTTLESTGMNPSA